MNFTEIDYGLIADKTWVLGLEQHRFGVKVDSIPEGSILSVSSDTHRLRYDVVAEYGHTTRLCASDVGDHFSIAVYGDMFHRGLRADRLSVSVWIPTDQRVMSVGSVSVSGLPFSRWEVPPAIFGPKDRSGHCPACGLRGEFVRTALCCPQHGAFAGF